jgi:hypothetical protein
VAPRGSFRCPCLLLSSFAALLICASAQPARSGQDAKPTAQRVEEQVWWPTSGKPALTEYVGAKACSECHAGIVRRQKATRMAHAAQRQAGDGGSSSDLKFNVPKAGIETDVSLGGDRSMYSVNRNGQSMSGEVLWAMGDGEIGKTFVLERKGDLFEGQLSYFTAVAGLDLTPGHTWEPVNDMEHQFGSRLELSEKQRCFSCHTTASTTQGKFDQQHAVAGVTCEACHGPGLRHVKAMESGDARKGLKAIFNPRTLSPVDLVDFCGACHRAPMDVRAEKEQSAVNIRFQPYRLAKSRCWMRPDARLTCIACHSPHDNLIRDLSSYDSKCLACHLGGQQPAAGESGKVAACPVGASRCVTCHMPRYQFPQLHGSFTDHFIRIVKPGEAFPL